MHIMTRIGKAVCDALGDDTGFIKGLHCAVQPRQGQQVYRPFRRTIRHLIELEYRRKRPVQEPSTSRCASLNLGRQEGWMAEHMLILGIQNPRGGSSRISAARQLHADGLTSPCSSRPRACSAGAGACGAWATISRGCASARTAELQAVNPENGFSACARHIHEVEPQRAHFHAQGHDLYERRLTSPPTHR